LTEEAISTIPDEGADFGKKDITEDIILSDEKREEELKAGEAAKPQGDHAVVTLLDMAIETGGDYLKKEGYPPPNDSIYKHFSRPFLNKAAWHYLPDEQLPDDPKIALLLGVGGLVLAFAPTLMEVYKRRQEEEKEEQIEEQKEEKREEKREEKKAEKKERTEYITDKAGVEAPVLPAHILRRLEMGGSL